MTRSESAGNNEARARRKNDGEAIVGVRICVNAGPSGDEGAESLTHAHSADPGSDETSENTARTMIVCPAAAGDATAMPSCTGKDGVIGPSNAVFPTCAGAPRPSDAKPSKTTGAKVVFAPGVGVPGESVYV